MYPEDYPTEATAHASLREAKSHNVEVRWQLILQTILLALILWRVW